MGRLAADWVTEDALRDCVSRGLSRKAAAAEFGVSVTCVIRRAERFGVQFANSRSDDPEILARVRDLAGRGLTMAAAADVLGVSPNTVRRIACRGGVAFRPLAARPVDKSGADLSPLMRHFWRRGRCVAVPLTAAEFARAVAGSGVDAQMALRQLCLAGLLLSQQVHRISVYSPSPRGAEVARKHGGLV